MVVQCAVKDIRWYSIRLDPFFSGTHKASMHDGSRYHHLHVPQPPRLAKAIDGLGPKSSSELSPHRRFSLRGHRRASDSRFEGRAIKRGRRLSSWNK